MKVMKQFDEPPHESNSGAGYPGALAFDPERYSTHMSGLDLTPEQRLELLTALWRIMSTFVELGWDVAKVPQLLPALIEGDIDAPNPHERPTTQESMSADAACE